LGVPTSRIGWKREISLTEISRKEEEEKKNDHNQLVVFRDIVEVPLHISDSNNEEELVERATLCIPSNIIKLSQQFGASFEG